MTSPRTYADDFAFGDIIEITNATTPAWGRGRWRVLEVWPTRVELEPVLADGSPDTQRQLAAIEPHRLTGLSGLVQRRSALA